MSWYDGEMRYPRRAAVVRAKRNLPDLPSPRFTQ